MDADYRTWRGPARTLARSVDAAVAAAVAGEAVAFDESLTDLRQAGPRRTDREQLLELLGTVTQDLLERAAPDGLDAEEAERVLRGCLHGAAPWFDGLDGDALLGAFTAAVGVAADAGDADGPAPTPDAVLAHGLLLVAHLVTTTRTPAPVVIDHALRELHRAQTMELP